VNARDTLVDRLRTRAGEGPRGPVLAFAGDDGRDVEARDLGGLLSRVETLSGFLASLGLRAGERVLLVYPPGLAFADALLACLLAGVIAVPCPPPDPRRAEDVARMGRIARDAGARIALTDTRFVRARRMASLTGLFVWARPAWPDLVWHTTDDVPTGSFPASRHAPRPEETAFVQYTSGSTADPRGVTLSHGNLDHQLGWHGRVLRCEEPSRAVCWAPHYHDLGLVAGILGAVFGNWALHLISPLSFLARPAVWAEVLTRTRATHTAAPHFGYALLLRKTTPAERQRYDLASLRVLFSGGEPIRQESMDAFFDAFATSGLARSAWCPAYGLAEHTVGVTVWGASVLRADRAALERGGVYRRAPASDSRAVTLVGCGRPEGDVAVRIVDPSTRAVVAPGSVGEIWIDSPSKATAYFGRDEATRELLQARLADPRDTRAYLRTGDRGLVWDGELFVIDRLKDLVIVGGRNVSPESIEALVRTASKAVRPGGVAAFGVPHPRHETEAVAVVVESGGSRLDEPAAREIAVAVRAAVAAGLGLPLATIVVGRRGLVSKTTSGKVRRRACREAFLAGSLEGAASGAFRFDFGVEPSLDREPAIHEIASRDEGERRTLVGERLARAVGRMLRLEAGELPGDAPLGSLGIDSLSLLDVAQIVEGDFGVALDPATAAEMSLDSLSDHVARRMTAAAMVVAEIAVDGAAGTDDSIPLTPNQLSFLDRLVGPPDGFCVLAYLRAPPSVDADALQEALGAAVQRHEALRVRIERTGSGWRQIAGAAPGPTLRRIDATDWGAGEAAARRLEILDGLQREIDLARGSIVSAAWLDRGPGAGLLVLLGSHLLIDAHSMRVFLGELEGAYAGRPRQEPDRSYGRWSRRLVERASSPPEAGTLAHWVEACGAEDARCFVAPDAAARDPYPPRPRMGSTSRAALDAAASARWLAEFPTARDQRTIFLAALARAWCALSGREELCVLLEDHGRAGEAGPRTIGWISHRFPVRVGVPRSADDRELARLVAADVAKTPGDGSSHGVLAWLGPDEEVRRRLTARRPHATLWYRAALDDIFDPRAIFPALHSTTVGRFFHEPDWGTDLELVAGVREGAVWWRLDYDPTFYGPASARRLSREIGAFLVALSSP
jgi:acyl-CoA synthetase (AMP-forming)/AMP-acid ligase II